MSLRLSLWPAKQRLQSQREPNRLIREVTGSEGFMRKIEGGPRDGFPISKPLHTPISKQFPTFQFLRIEARPHFIEGSNGAAILEKPVSDRGTLEDVSQSPQSSFKRCRKLLILNGEMLEWSIRHAWKACESSYAAAKQNSKYGWLRTPQPQPYSLLLHQHQ